MNHEPVPGARNGATRAAALDRVGCSTSRAELDPRVLPHGVRIGGANRPNTLLTFADLEPHRESI